MENTATNTNHAKDINIDISTERLFYTVDEIYRKKIIPVGRNKLYDLVHRQDFPKLQVGRNILIPKEGLLEWSRTTWDSVKSMY